MPKGPPGWLAHKIVTRLDGYFVDPHDDTRIPPAIAEVIARAMPQPTAIEIIRARMIARQRRVLGDDE